MLTSIPITAAPRAIAVRKVRESNLKKYPMDEFVIVATNC
jgi:hypothetical protein